MIALALVCFAAWVAWSEVGTAGRRAGLRVTVARWLPGDAGSRAYKRYLSSPHWRARRAKRRDRACERCEDCGCVPSRGEVHHLHYRRRGHERLGDLRYLCPSCHGARRGEKWRRSFRWWVVVKALGFAAGLLILLSKVL